MKYLYIAAASSEISRVRTLVAAIKEINLTIENQEDHIVITHDWCSVIEERGHANPSNAPYHERLQYATEDIKGVKYADLLWALMPSPGHASVGLWWECGYADSLGTDIVISGTGHESSIFTSRAACFNTDYAALEYIKDLVMNDIDYGRAVTHR